MHSGGSQFGFAQATPHPVGLARGQGVITALPHDWALETHLFGVLIPPTPCGSPFPVGMEKQGRTQRATQPVILPLPSVSAGTATHHSTGRGEPVPNPVTGQQVEQPGQH